MCGLQADDILAKDPGEALQTTTVPLNEVRCEFREWKDAMIKEYSSLVHEAKAIEPVDLSMLNQEAGVCSGKTCDCSKSGSKWWEKEM